ncbi:MAG: hypothetical protein BME93_00105 [Methanosarcinales archaeon Met12]|nr:MAG: hypothetical protein BME93_00105 [Methanosarcinales archaeon Met12]
MYLVKPCKTSAAYEAIPDKDLCFDIDESAERLKQDYDIVANAKIMLIVKGACEISIHRTGKLIIKTDSEEKAKEAADKIYELLR